MTSDKGVVERLRIKADMIQMGEKIAWGSDSAIMREAAARIETLERALEGATTALTCIAHTFTEDSHGGTKTLPATDYQRMAREALAALSPSTNGAEK